MKIKKHIFFFIYTLLFNLIGGGCFAFSEIATSSFVSHTSFVEEKQEKKEDKFFIQEVVEQIEEVEDDSNPSVELESFSIISDPTNFSTYYHCLAQFVYSKSVATYVTSISLFLLYRNLRN